MTNHQTVNSITHSAPDSASQAETAVKPPVSTNRREVLKMTSAALAIPSVSVGSFIPDALGEPFNAEGDKKLLALVEELQLVARQRTKKWEARKALRAEAEKNYPPLPEVTRATKQDLTEFRFPRPVEAFGKPVKHYTRFMRESLAIRSCNRPADIPLKKWLAMNKGNTKSTWVVKDGVVLKYVLWPEAIKRRDEIVAAIDKHSKQCRAIDKRMGLYANDKELDQLEDRYSDLLQAIEEQPTESAMGLVAKAAAIGSFQRAGKSVTFGDLPDERLASQIVNLLLRIDPKMALA